ncbi:MAG: 50S ribosomal protein L20 [Nitrospirae bacterium CG18_big_fil_WC_8_21_14_2_50_70_55]|nr:50S ribosomal protein L20 [Deltaproteobacteria bacterium]OIP63767.1 MAG: 50S ribosomal protein L20 [Nitrospirae bacterium CG2_30_70_394]PIQ03073.1 MAG: 50S ribosomal protein L20 [Nitrospirae bacterium CG18_big_fil_WC_8_21_14_2_50_70_55]PIU77882.1 MAG: 50S ribosomal protein L20 [Nitrospirae bacterium CG06_land_8_20_14_3_00_70_43]PIW83573.1 MAG: 50S ribosomal protein L20 [Nitrospirae bacterium CG_4_8_14_3_um_filter_70_85]PIX84110.1 MAG: 50S ribosomal protein L20 [Nitrospirae bacterium CG_4_10
MPRAKGGYKTHRRHKKVLARAAGFRGGRSRLYRSAREAVDHALVYAYRDRRVRKRDFRSLWIARISAASRGLGLPYSRLIAGLTRAQVQINRKMLSELAIYHPADFASVVSLAREQL